MQAHCTDCIDLLLPLLVFPPICYTPHAAAAASALLLIFPWLAKTILWVSFARISIFWVWAFACYLLSHSGLSFTQPLLHQQLHNNNINIIIISLIISLIIIIAVIIITEFCQSAAACEPLQHSRLNKQLECACCGCCSCFLSLTSFLNEIKVFAMINPQENYVKFKVMAAERGKGGLADEDDGKCHASLPDSFAM